MLNHYRIATERFLYMSYSNYQKVWRSEKNTVFRKEILAGSKRRAEGSFSTVRPTGKSWLHMHPKAKLALYCSLATWAMLSQMVTLDLAWCVYVP